MSTYACHRCGLLFASRPLAVACEEWCRTHDSCHLEIGRQAIGRLPD